jgi:tetratricopeptide (TPR) repeat protein
MDYKRTLLSIITYARTGAQEYAWRLLREAGLDRLEDDPEVLSVVGRLLKDRAIGALGEERRRYLLESAAAYSKAATISGATYPLINAATLSLLAGERNKSEELARKVLELNESGRDGGETPYWRAATRAEALMLLGDIPSAGRILVDGIKLAPRAYEDHASTLRQFALILEALEEDASWLDACRPPLCLHFAGHMSVSPDGNATIEAIRQFVEEARVGFGYGALAAGADLLVADALLQAGAELHVVLPADAALFCSRSVAPAGTDWVRRFERILNNAESVRFLETGAEPTASAALQLAAEVAMGCAIMRAQILMTKAVQLAITDGTAPTELHAGGSHWVAARWHSTGRRQRILTAPRRGYAFRSVTEIDPRSANGQVAAMLRIETRDTDRDLLARDILPVMAEAVARTKAVPLSVRCTRESLILACRTPLESVRIGLELVGTFGQTTKLCIAGHYGVFNELADAFHETPLLAGDAANLPCEMIQSVPPAAFYVTENFAAALHVSPPIRWWRTEYIGELPLEGLARPIPLYSVRR